MRNLKKALSLVLALVFVLGLCTIGAGAAFTDADQIQYKEAITVLNGLGILEGYGDGKFGPLDNLTREQAAKMIAYMMLGEANAEKLINKQVFDDVAATRWSAKYIYFCYQKGIINGYGDGNFGPADNVTGTQLAKMLLCAAGYGCMGEYTGEGWDVNVFIDAVSEGIFEDAKTEDYSAIATREEAALYVFNTLTDVAQVKYDVDQNKYLGYKGTFGYEVWKLVSTAEDDMVHVVTENQATGADYTVIDGVNFAIETGLDVIGHDVDVYFKADLKKDADNNNYYEAYLVEDVSTVIASSIQTIGELAKQVAFVDTDLDTVEVWTNYVMSGDSLADSIAAAGIVFPSFEKGTEITVFGSTTKVEKANNVDAFHYAMFVFSGNIILDAEGEILSAMNTTYDVLEVKDIEDGAITLEDGEVYYPAAVADEGDAVYMEAYEGIAKEDYVTLQPVGDVFYLYPTSETELYIFEAGFLGGYNFYGLVGTSAESVVEPTLEAGNTYKLYMDYYGYFFDAELVLTAANSNVLLVSVYTVAGEDAFGDPAVTYYAQYVDAEGNEVIATLYSGKAAPAADEKGYAAYQAAEALLAEYSSAPVGVKKAYVGNDGYMKFIDITAEPNVTSNTKTFKGDGKDVSVASGYYLTEDADIYYVNGEKATLEVEAGSIFEEGSYTVYFYGVKNGTAIDVSVVWVYGVEAPVEYAASYVYSLDGYGFGLGTVHTGTQYINNEIVYYFEVYMDGAIAYIPVAVDSEGFADNNFFASMPGFEAFAGYYVEPGFYMFEVDEYGVYTLTKVAETAKVAQKIVELSKYDIRNGKLTVNGAKGCDNIDISGLKVVDESGAVNSKGYPRNISSVDAIEDLLDDGYTVTVSYLAIKDADDNFVPQTVLYITSIVDPGV